MNRTAAVLGPGAVGGSLAVRLATAGVQVVCVAPPETAGLIALAGLVLETPQGTVSARLESVDQLVKPVGILVVAVKAPALDEAIARVDPAAVADGVVVPLLNGLEHMQPLRDRFGDRVIVGSISHYQAYRTSRVQVVETTPPPVVTLASNTLPRTTVEAVADVFRQARLDVRVGQDEQRVLWHKLVRIAPLAAATAASGRTVGALRADPEWRPRLDAAIVEACSVAEADGVSLRPAAQWAIIDEMAGETTTSAARDVAAGRRSELNAILGGVLRAAERLGVPTPALVELAASAGLR